ncbi:HAD-IC family P-type ATPase [Enterococcus gallinarum]|nr:HAD-IC family P-type ATPase [Enterococcus gallinarum]
MVIYLKEMNHTVAMTGDGVNDVLALKEADCSIAMASGVDAARQVANLVLLENQFSALPSVLDEGRRVINNITRSGSLVLVQVLFSILITMGTLLSGTAYPFEPIQLTIINACFVGIPTFLLNFEPISIGSKAPFCLLFSKMPSRLRCQSQLEHYLLLISGTCSAAVVKLYRSCV